MDTEMSKPTERELDERLKKVVEWERFALYLPEIKQEDIDMIKKDRPNGTLDQKLYLYKVWLKKHPDASWSDVVEALEKIDEKSMAYDLKKKFHTVENMKQEISEINGQVARKVHIQVSENVVEELQKLHDEFVSLIKELKKIVKRNADNDSNSLKELICDLEEHKAFQIDFHSVQTTEKFFQAIEPHYNFLNCFIIFRIARELKGTIANKAEEYNSKTEKFRKETQVVKLHKNLQPYYNNYKSDTSIKVIIEVQKTWDEQCMWLVEKLVCTLFRLKHGDKRACQWFSVNPGSVIVTFIAPKHLMKTFIENAKNRIQFMKLTGVIRLHIGGLSIYKGKNNSMFTFESSLIHATVENNIEAAQFLFQHVRVNVNTQTTQPIINTTTDQLYSSESDSTVRLRYFETSFSKLMNDIKLELTEIEAEKLSEGSTCNFLNCHLLAGMEQKLPLTNSDIHNRINTHIEDIEKFKKLTKVTHLQESLKEYFPTPRDNYVKISMKLENAWRKCSMWFVERLLQAIFSSHHIEIEWFRVENESMCVIFLAPNHLTTSLIEIGMEKKHFLRLTGVLELQIGDNHILETEAIADEHFTFENATDRARALNDKEAVTLLEEITQEPLTPIEIYQKDNNGNFILNIDTGATPLIIACSNNNEHLVKLLLQANANPNIQTERKLNALMYVSMIGNHRIFKMILESKGDIDQTSIFDETVMHIGCLTGTIGIVRLLLAERKEMVNMKDITGETPLHRASYHGYEKIVKLLLEAKADPNLQNNDGETPLHRASDQKHLGVVEELLQAKANPNTRDSFGRTSLHTAVNSRYLPIIKELLQAQAHLDIKDDNGKTPLDIAKQTGNFYIIEILRRQGTN